MKPKHESGRLNALQRQGQSVWLDFLRRQMLQSGELQQRIAGGLRGITSNPSIFEKAIGENDDYDDALRNMPASLPDRAAFERLAVSDVQHAADQLRAVYDDSGGADGFVSLEVAPGLARNTAGTIAEARRLWQWVARPNVMIKIPGTRQGWPAIEHCLAAGINVNVTLLFSVENYREVVQAHLRALEKRLHRNLPIDQIASVASFFVSRVDSAIEKQLKRKKAELKKFAGKTGIANARLAYALFEETLASDRWRAVAAAGARAQRPLWASTGTKNPKFSDVLYVENLIGPNTVNTLPPDTLAAFEKHGRVAPTLRGHARESAQLIAALENTGVDFAEVTRQLEDEGIAAFAKSYKGLLRVIAKKRRTLSAGRKSNSGGPAAMQLGMVGLGRMGSNMVRRLLAKNHDCVVYDPGPAAARKLASQGAVAARSLRDLVKKLNRPRVLWLMVPAQAVDSVLRQLTPLLDKNDIVVDGGNSHYRDGMRRAAALTKDGIFFVDVGTSGGIHGRERGYCLMIGGAHKPVRALTPVFASLAPGRGDLEPSSPQITKSSSAGLGYLHCGPSGAGHFVKMVHNGIEYGLMAAYAEGFNLLAHANANAGAAYRYPFDLTQIAEVWRRGSVIGSWLLDLIARSLSDDPGLKKFTGRVPDSGEGRWALKAALDTAVPTPVLAAALAQRFSSRGENEFADRLLSALRQQFGGHRESATPRKAKRT